MKRQIKYRDRHVFRISPSVSQALRQMSDILEGGRRKRVYRHHLFHRKCSQLVAHMNASTSTSKEGSVVVRKMLLEAGRAVTAEVLAERIDTMGMCLTLLSLLAGLHVHVRGEQ